ncbi:MAG TPA: VIT domain-containing protein [Myxococcales bacterium]|nr:VIT domain-containing protein [Myxococcales bacterium]
MTLAIPLVDIPSGLPRGLGSLKAKEQPLPLQDVRIRARVVDRVAEVTVEQKFGNPFKDLLEAVYVFPLAGGSAVSRFEMQIGKRTVRARIEERGEARRQYAEALEQGKRAALLEQERDDVFTVQVGNIIPGEDLVARLTYTERLPFFEDGRTEIRLPLVVAPRYVGGEELERPAVGHGVAQDTSTVPDASRITPPRLAPGFDPKVSLGIEVELYGGFPDLACSQHAVSTSSGPEAMRVSLSREREPLDRDFALRWRVAGEQVKSQLLAHGGFAVLSLLPPARAGFLGAPRDVVFVVDRSGSMQGPKMASAARACALLLRTLGPRDRFQVQAFDNVVEWMPGGFSPADEEGIERGEKWLRGIFARGGTELDGAMREALQRVRDRGEGEGRAPVVVLLTDGQVGDESSVLKRLQAELGEARVFTVGIDTAVNDGFLRRLAALGGGTSALVEPGARLEEALQAVGREIGAPLVTGLRIEGEAAEIAPARMPDLFAGRASTVFFRGGASRVKVSGLWADGSRFEQEVEAKEAPLAAIEHLWARARISDLEDEFRATQSEAAKKEIVALSLRHTVLTRLTAFVVVDDEVVNKGGGRRTVVQPVAMPVEWEAGGIAHATLGAAIPRSFEALAGAPGPVRARSSMPAVMAQKTGHRLLSTTRGGAAPTSVHRPPPQEPATQAQREAVRRALEAFLRAFADLKRGAVRAEELERARAELLRALGESRAIAPAVPLLQAFLRGAAVELVAAVRAGAADAALLDRHARALEAARDQARPVLDGKDSPAESFWEASI